MKSSAIILLLFILQTIVVSASAMQQQQDAPQQVEQAAQPVQTPPQQQRQETLDTSAVVKAEQQSDEQPLDQATELLTFIDSLRGYQGESFQFTLSNISFKKNKQKSRNQLQVKVLDDSALVDFVAPARSKGRKILKQGQNMWIRFPRTRNVLRISAAQRLLGEASNGDVTGTNFSLDYNPIEITNNEITQGDKNINARQLTLEAKHDKATYNKVVFYLNPDNNLPIRSDFYARSGKLAKQAYYTKFKEFDGQLKLHRMRLDDPLVEGSYTWMSFDDYQKVSLGSATFHKDALSR